MTLLEELLLSGASVALVGDGVAIKHAPPELLARAKEEKPRLVAQLRAHAMDPQLSTSRYALPMRVMCDTASRISFDGIECQEFINNLAIINRAFAESYEQGEQAIQSLSVKMLAMAEDIAIRCGYPLLSGQPLYDAARREFAMDSEAFA